MPLHFDDDDDFQKQFDERDLLKALIYLGVQGETLRVSNRIREGVPLNTSDTVVRNCGVGTVGEHIEAGRRALLKVLKMLYEPATVKKIVDEIIERTKNEAGDKP